MECLGCIAGCLVCLLEDQDLCEVCQPPLLIMNQTCVAICPLTYGPSYDGTRCEPQGELPVIYFPLLILTGLALVIAIGGKCSSKNVFGLHRKLLSFYALAGVVDVLAIWA